MADQTGEEDLRKREWESDVKGFALQEYDLIEDLSIAGASAWTNSYYQETSTPLTYTGTARIKGLGRKSEFPTAKMTWTEKNSIIDKYGLEDEISWEDAISDNIDVIGRTLQRIAEGVVKAVEDEIFDVVSESQAATNINFTDASIDWAYVPEARLSGPTLIDDLMECMQEIAESNYKEIYKGAGFLWLRPLHYRELLTWLFLMGAQAPKFGEMVLADGRIQQTFLGLKVRVSNSITEGFALIGVSKKCATWRELQALEVGIDVERGKKYTVRAFQYGVTQLVNPKSISLLSGI